MGLKLIIYLMLIQKRQFGLLYQSEILVSMTFRRLDPVIAIFEFLLIKSTNKKLS